jgi:transcriptional regulator with XRE-family HTH domain
VANDPRNGARPKELAEYLRHCRAARRPEEFGMAGGERRRVRGLRREEVAVLAHVSSTWYTELEQGRQVRPTAEVLDSIALGLRMSRDEHDYLRSLGGYPPTHDVDVEIPTVPPALYRLIEDLPHPATVTTPWFDYLAWNSAFVSLMCFDPGALPAHCRNPLYLWTVMDHSSLSMRRSEALEESLVARLRYEFAEYGDHPLFKATLDRLCASNDNFRRAWEQHDVRRSMDVGTVVIDHPIVGRVEVQPVRLIVQDHPILRLGTYVSVDEDSRHKLETLRERATAGDVFTEPLEAIFSTT